MRLRQHELILLLGLCLPGCYDGEAARQAGPFVPPNLDGSYLDEQQVLRPVVHTLSILRFGEQVEGILPGPEQLAGHEFQAVAHTIPYVELETGGAPLAPALALYGPRSERGLWGRALTLTAADAAGRLELEPIDLPSPGTYLILLGDRLGAVPGQYRLSLGCRGSCLVPDCPELEPCNLVCESELLQDPHGCRICECAPLPECSGAHPCGAQEVCGIDGRCHPQPESCQACPGHFKPVCGVDGRTYGNRCQAECKQVVVQHDGHCPGPIPCEAEQSCPEGLICQDGLCTEPDCRCEEPERPVCSQSGRTWRSECEMRCRPGEELVHFGACRDHGCFWDFECPPDQACLPAPEPENLEICTANFWDPTCRRACQPIGFPPCRADRDCAADQFCWTTEAGGGVCLARCRLPDPEGCPPRLRCARLEGGPAADGLCLPPCSPHRGFCPPGASCGPDLTGQLICQPCACPDDPLAEPVCSIDHRTFTSECAAQCAGVELYFPGACHETPLCICPPWLEPTCGSDGKIYASRCELSCSSGIEEREMRSCLGDQVQLACRSDHDCLTTGCAGSVCAAAATAACPVYTDWAAVLLLTGVCGCVEGQCSFGQLWDGWRPEEDDHHRREREPPACPGKG